MVVYGLHKYSNNKYINPFYAVGKGRTTGIFTTYKGFSGAMFKKFDTKGDAEGFIHSHKITRLLYGDGLSGNRPITSPNSWRYLLCMMS